MTEDDLKHIEQTADATKRLAVGMRSSEINFWTRGDCDIVEQTADTLAKLVAEVRRLRAGVILPGVEQSAELAKMLVRKHGNATNHPRRIMVLPESELTLICPVTTAEKAELIADLQRTPVEELVQFWDQRGGVVGIGCKLKPASEAAEPQHVVEGK